MKRIEMQPYLVGLLAAISAEFDTTTSGDSPLAQAASWLYLAREAIAIGVFAGTVPKALPIHSAAASYILKSFGDCLPSDTPKHRERLARAIGYESENIDGAKQLLAAAGAVKKMAVTLGDFLAVAKSANFGFTYGAGFTKSTPQFSPAAAPGHTHVTEAAVAGQAEPVMVVASYSPALLTANPANPAVKKAHPPPETPGKPAEAKAGMPKPAGWG